MRRFVSVEVVRISYEFRNLTASGGCAMATRNGETTAKKWVAYGGIEPAKVDAVAREHTRRAVCDSARVLAEGEADEAMRAEYKRLGYRLLVTEPLFVHDLKRIPRDCTAR